MKKPAFLIFIIAFISSNIFCQDLRNASVSFDPLTLIRTAGFLINMNDTDPEDQRELNFNNIWFGMDSNWVTKNKKEMGVGVFLGSHKIAFKTQYRSFYNKERQSGFFWGLFGLTEWRRMYWYYEENDEIMVGWGLPFNEQENVYHSFGITGGFDTGFRYRTGNLGVTPYLGLGIPLFYCFGNMPVNNIQDFNVMNIALRAIHIGVRIDVFND